MEKFRDVPEFENGVLPPGDYELTLEELENSKLVKGFKVKNIHSSWDNEWRLYLVKNLSILVKQLVAIGIEEIFIDGSFVEDKDHPNDIDGYFICDPYRFFSGEIERKLNALDPYQIWIWKEAERKVYRDSPKKHLPMWHQYRVEFYPHYSKGLNSSGILDPDGFELEFPSAFRRRRSDFCLKGIVKIDVKGIRNDKN